MLRNDKIFPTAFLAFLFRLVAGVLDGAAKGRMVPLVDVFGHRFAFFAKLDEGFIHSGWPARRQVRVSHLTFSMPDALNYTRDPGSRAVE